MDLPKEALEEYVSEGDEIIQRVSSNLALIENSTYDRETINTLYRDMHTLKGSSMLFGFNNIGEIGHVLESCLDPVRRLNCPISAEFIGFVYTCLDLIEKYMEHIRETGQESEDYREEKNLVISKLIEISTNQYGEEISGQNDHIMTENLADEKQEISGIENEKGTQDTQLSGDESMATGAGDKPSSEVISNPLSPASDTMAPEPQMTTETAALVSAAKLGESKNQPVKLVPASNGESNKMNMERREEHPKNTAEQSHGVGRDSTIRVSVDLLDKMMNLVGELVLVRNQVLQFSRKYEDMEFANLSQSMDIVTTDLQGEIMKTRMQPIGNVLNKYTRIVRDTAIELDKKIRLELVGVDTELDKTLLEAIRDPLTHIIRNSCDHGIESKEVRAKSNKPEEGTITIKSFHEGGQVSIEIVDDGGGIDTQRVLEKAVEKGLVSREKAKTLSEKEVFSLILAPGFSTAEKVTSVSGRGVGMDVVKTNIEKIGGNIEINSVAGVGSEMRLKIPLTLAIVPAMLVRIHQAIYCIPQIRLVELVRVEPKENGTAAIEMLQGKPVFRLRGELLALVSLSEILGCEQERDVDWEQGTFNIVVLSSDGSYFGLMVDEILDTADIVVKPISQFLKTSRYFSGATIMGNGSVALILDVVGISDGINMGEKGQGCESAIEMRDSQNQPSADLQEFLTFSVGEANKYAIPLCLVHRLEKFDASEIEISGAQRVTQYRGAILPIVDLKYELGFRSRSVVASDGSRSNSLESITSSAGNTNATQPQAETVKQNKSDVRSAVTDHDPAEEEAVTVIVTQKSGMFFGVQVDDIEDVVTIAGDVNEAITDRKGIHGNIVHDDQMTVIVDILSVLENVVASFARIDQPKAKAMGAGAEAGVPIPVANVPAVVARNAIKPKVLLVEDTPFFRKKLVNILQNAGYEVMATTNGKEAMEHLQGRAENEYQLILSDIEMPHADGYELAEYVRNDLNFKEVPMIAITTRFRDRDVKKGKAVGFDIYMEKLNEIELLSNMNLLLQKGA